MFLTRPTGAESNAGLWEFTAQVEDCDWRNAGRRRGRGGSSVFAAGGFGGFAAAAIEPTAGGIVQEDAPGGTAGWHGQKDCARQGSDHRVLQGPLCREGFRSRERTGETGVGKQGPDRAGEIQTRGCRKLRRNSGRNRGKFFGRLPATGAVHQYAGAVEGVFCRGWGGPGRRKRGAGQTANHDAQLSAVGCLSETGNRKPGPSHRAGDLRRDSSGDRRIRVLALVVDDGTDNGADERNIGQARHKTHVFGEIGACGWAATRSYAWLEPAQPKRGEKVRGERKKYFWRRFGAKNVSTVSRVLGLLALAEQVKVKRRIESRLNH